MIDKKDTIILSKGVSNKQKKIIYILLVTIFLASLFVFIYLVFMAINTHSKLIILDETTNKYIGILIITISAIFGRPIGKKWWENIYGKNRT